MKKSKRDIIIEHAIELFNQYGTKKVTVEEICDKSNTSKGTFYKNFSNKLDLIIHIFNVFVKDANKRFQSFLDRGLEFETLVKEILHLKQEFMEKYSPRFLKDLSDSDNTEIQKLYQKKIADSLNNSLIMYQLGIGQGKINNQVTSEFFLYQLEVLEKTRTDPRVIKMYPDLNKRNMVIFEQFFYGLVKRN